MATEHEEDLSELDGDALHDRIRELVDEGWKPVTLTLTREKDPKDDENLVLRDEPRG